MLMLLSLFPISMSVLYDLFRLALPSLVQMMMMMEMTKISQTIEGLIDVAIVSSMSMSCNRCHCSRRRKKVDTNSHTINQYLHIASHITHHTSHITPYTTRHTPHEQKATWSLFDRERKGASSFVLSTFDSVGGHMHMYISSVSFLSGKNSHGYIRHINLPRDRSRAREGGGGVHNNSRKSCRTDCAFFPHDSAVVLLAFSPTVGLLVMERKVDR